MDFDNITKQLKTEFIGIDSQIDQVINIIKPWYNNPQLYMQPCIVNLWGMTGHGKTSLINRIIDLMGEGHNKMYMNCHSMMDMDLYFMDSFIDDCNTDRSTTNKFIIFDDFQYVRTIDEDGKESSTSALSVMWNIMDTGVIHEPFSATNFKMVRNIINVLNKIDDNSDIENGIMKHKDKYIPEKYRRSVSCVFNLCDKKSKKITDESFLLSHDTVENVTWIGRRLGYADCDSPLDFIEERLSWGAFQWRDFFNNLYNSMKKGDNYDFHNSIIFVIGNLDEAFYGTAKEVNPEMSTDQLYEITSKINIVDIKKGLQKRFRNEQVARLGNTHIIYPSFTSDNYKNIIIRYLKLYSDGIKRVSGLDLEFHQSILDCIYDEGVFPSQGVRPLFSTINDMIKPNVPKVIDMINTKGITNCTKLVCLFDKALKSIVITYGDNDNVFGDMTLQLTLRVKGAYKDNSETIANTSVHESGHFILYKYLTGKSPVKVISRSLEQSCLGYMMEKFDEGVISKSSVLNEIAVCLGGYAAENLVFGDDLQSTGASSDIENATSIAVSLLNEWGFSEKGPVRISVTDVVDNENTVLLTRDERNAFNKEVRKIIDRSLQLATSLLNDNKVLRECFIDSFNRLNDKGELTDEDIQEISSKIETAEGYNPIQSDYYKAALNRFK